MAYAPGLAPDLWKVGLVPGTIPGRFGALCTGSVRCLGPSLLALAMALAVVSTTARAGPPGASDQADLERAQAAGWLELKRDQARYRQQFERPGVAPAPTVGLDLGLLERQEDLDRRALDQRQARALEDARRHDRLVDQGALTVPRGPTLHLQRGQAEAAERLRRYLRRQTLTPVAPMAPIPTPPPFRLR